jgi:beta-mannosidase
VVHPNDERYGTRHEWEAWNREDYTWHDRFTPRFCTEFGWQAPPTWATLTSAIGTAALSKESAAFLLHQKADDGNGKLDRGLAHHMAVPEDFADWHWATQLNQARATAYAIAHLRSHMPHTMGSVLWQLNDCWPVTSWAVVDGAGRRKPAWYALRRSYAPRLLALRGGSSVVAVNDSDQTWSGSVRLRRLSFEGAEVGAASVALQASPRTVVVLDVPSELSGPDLLVAECDGLRATWLEAGEFDPYPIAALADRVPGGYAVTVTAASFARDVAVLADRVAPDAVVDEQLVDLLPGETRVFTVRTAAVVDPELFLAPEVLRSANTLAPKGKS